MIVDPVFGFDRAQWLDYAAYLVRHNYADGSVIEVVEAEFGKD